MRDVSLSLSVSFALFLKWITISLSEDLKKTQHIRAQRKTILVLEKNLKKNSDIYSEVWEEKSQRKQIIKEAEIRKEFLEIRNMTAKMKNKERNKMGVE